MIYRWAAFLLIALGTARVAATHAVFSPTFDEEFQIACGVHWWDRGTYKTEVQHPPLSRIVMAALPYWAGARSAGQVNTTKEGQAMMLMLGLPRGIVLARRGILIFFPLLCLGVWCWARWLGGDRAAMIAVLAVSMLPPVLAHAGLATTDLAVTATITWALFLVLRWWRRPGWTAAAAAGLALGLAVGSKFSVFVFFPVALLVLLMLERPVGRPPLAQVPLLVGAMLLVLLALYRFPVNLPLSGLVDGVRSVWEHSKEGHWSYLLGRIGQHGWWYFHPVVFAVKTPLAFLGLTALSLFAPRSRAFTLAGLAILAVSMFASINLGIRHVLPMYPLLAISVGLAAERFRYPAWGLLACLTITSLWAAPDYLSEFNLLAGAHPEKVRVDSDLDWGQDMFRLAERCRALQIGKLNASVHAPFDAEALGLPPTWDLDPGAKSSGWVAVSLSRRMMHNADAHAIEWLDAYQPVERVGKTIDLYYIRNPQWPDRAAELDRWSEYNRTDAPSWAPVLHVDKALQGRIAAGEWRVWNWDGFEFHWGLNKGIAWIGGGQRFLRARVWAKDAMRVRVRVETDTGFSHTDQKRRLELASNGKSFGLKSYEAPAEVVWEAELSSGINQLVLRTPDRANLPFTYDDRDLLIKILGVYFEKLQ